MRGTRHRTEIDVASRRQEIHAVATTFRVRASIHFVEESVEHILQDRIRVVVIIPKLGRLVPEQLPYFLLTFEVIRYRGCGTTSSPVDSPLGKWSCEWRVRHGRRIA